MRRIKLRDTLINITGVFFLPFQPLLFDFYTRHAVACYRHVQTLIVPLYFTLLLQTWVQEGTPPPSTKLTVKSEQPRRQQAGRRVLGRV